MIILDNISNNEYHEGERWKKYVSSTSLKHYLRSPKYFKWFQDHGDAGISFEASHFGSVYHSYKESLTNGGDLTLFNEEYAQFDHPLNKKTGEPVGINTKGYQDLYTGTCLNNDSEACSDHVYKIIETMHREMMYDPVYGKWIEKKIKLGKAERSYFIEYPGGGFFKIRTDLETKNIILDWKTCREEYPRIDLFPKHIIDMGYHISAAMYQYFIHEATGRWKKFYWVVQEKTPPYDIMVYDSSDWTWDIINDGEGGIMAFPKVGARIFLELLRVHIECLNNNKWPGYSSFVQPNWKGNKLHRLEVPGWYENKAELINYNL